MNFPNFRHALAAIFVFAACLQALPAGTLGYYTYEDTGTSIKITSTNRILNGAISIPGTIDGKPVTEIGPFAFYTNHRITSVIIPPSVTSIGEEVFYNCRSLQSVNIPANVTSIGNRAFIGCTSLEGIVLPDGVTSLGEGTFSGCEKLKSFTFPKSITSISKGMFSGCKRLTNVVIPPHVTVIGDSAFWSSGLESLTIPSSVTSVGSAAFESCAKLKEVKIDANLTEISTGMFRNCEVLREAELPESILNIGDVAFEASGLRKAILPSKLKSMGKAVFRDCAKLRRVELPDGLKEIGASAFAGSALSEVDLNGVKWIGSGAFNSCHQLVTIKIPKSVKTIEDRAFFDCEKLAGACFEGNAPEMGERVFDRAAYDFRIFVEDNSKGFSVPRWLDYRLTPPKGEIAVDGFEQPYLRSGAYNRKFGQVPVGKKSIPYAFELTNVGNRPLTYLRASIKGENSSDFIITLPPKTSLAPGKSTTVKIIFLPKEKGIRKATLELQTPDADEGNFEILLSGIGIQFI